MPAELYQRPASASPQAPAPLLVDEKAAAALLGGICVKTLYNLRRHHALPYVQIGARIMYRPADLAKWIDAQAQVMAEGSGNHE